MTTSTDMPHARLGSYGKAVHQLRLHERYPGVGGPWDWGVSLCGGWAGEARVTDEKISCRACLQATRKE